MKKMNSIDKETDSILGKVLATEGMSIEKAFNIVYQDNQGLSDEELAERIADISGKSYQEVMDWFH